MTALNKATLWVVTAVAVAFLFFPSYIGAFLAPSNSHKVTDAMNKAFFHVEGMTCEGCASIAEKAIRDVPGVLAAEVDYATQRAVVGTESSRPVPVESIQAALKSVGYTGHLLGDGDAAGDKQEHEGQ